MKILDISAKHDAKRSFINVVNKTGRRKLVSVYAINSTVHRLCMRCMCRCACTCVCVIDPLDHLL